MSNRVRVPVLWHLHGLRRHHPPKPHFVVGFKQQFANPLATGLNGPPSLDWLDVGNVGQGEVQVSKFADYGIA